ncbi:hypothetical protein NFI96_030480 [Prochilodus magdalenae]|nr:hypothetical protein NFI96_030480 [Prochilodus magdalenae]
MGQVWHCLISYWGCLSLLFIVFAEEKLEMGCPNECKNADFVPGYNLGGEGFDIVKMERKGSYVIDMEKWDIGNGSCKMYGNAYLKNAKQKTPVAVEFWRALPKCSQKVISQIYYSSEALENVSTSSVLNDWKFGLNLPCCISGIMFGGTRSRESQFGQVKSKEDQFSFTKHVVQCSLYSYKIASMPPLHEEFLHAVQSLPPNYKPHLYQSIITTFGTHYITGVNLGGQLKAVTAIRSCKASLLGLTDTAIKDCLDLEASVLDIVKAEYKYCKELKKKMKTSESFSVLFSERHTETLGGNMNGADFIFSGGSNQHARAKWLHSLKTIPDVVTYTLQPLHLLLHDKHHAKKALKKAIEKYISENSLKEVCSESCKLGRRTNARDRCACVCEQNQNILSNCCPADIGLARLKVSNLSAKGLYGDYITETDAFVKVRYGDKVRRTEVIPNNDNPTWNISMEFVAVNIAITRKLTFQVYDEDILRNTLLGECSFDLRSGCMNDMCTFKYGTFYFSYTVQCAPHLQGPRCADYSPSTMPSTLAKIFHSRNGILAKDMPKVYYEGHYKE